MSDGAILQFSDGRTANVRASETKIGQLLSAYPGCKIVEGGYDQILPDVQLEAGRTYVITLAKSSGDDKDKTGKKFDKAAYLAVPVVLHSFEQNGDGIPMCGREAQVKIVADTVERLPSLNSAQKLPVLTVTSSRGMGKTFFVKKLCRMRDGPLTPSRKLGRIVAMECEQALKDLGADLVAFWSRLIAYHLLILFNDCVVNVGGEKIHFVAKDLGVVKQLAESDALFQDPLSRWIKKVANLPIKEAIQVLVEMTKDEFGVDESVSKRANPVFVLDNAHNFARVLTDTKTHKGESHTMLSLLLSFLAPVRPICIVAGTDDGNLKLLGDSSNITPVVLDLEPLDVKYNNALGAAYFAYENKVRGLSLVWTNLPIHDQDNVEDQTECIVDFQMQDAESLLNTSCEDDYETLPQVPPTVTACESLSAEEAALLAMFYMASQIPRLIRIACINWYNGLLAKKSPQEITVAFEREARDYYYNALHTITSFDTKDFALLFLACNTHWPLPITASFGSRTMAELMHMALIFPYRISKERLYCFTMPAVFWQGFNSSILDAEIATKWEQVKTQISTLVPNLDWRILCQSFSSWWDKALDIATLGKQFERVVTASLATTFCLWQQISHGNQCALTDIYAVSNEAQAYDICSSLQVDFSAGLQYSESEVTTTTPELEHAVYVNSLIATARHDAVLYSSPQATALQLMFSMQAPGGHLIAPQLCAPSRLLWVYLGYDEDGGELPKQFATRSVRQALEKRQLGFLSGAGCVSPFTIDFFLLMKQLVRAIVKKV